MMKLFLVAILITLGACAESLHLTADELAAHQPLRELKTFYDMHDPSSETFPEHFRSVISSVAYLIEKCSSSCVTSCMKTPGLTIQQQPRCLLDCRCLKPSSHSLTWLTIILFAAILSFILFKAFHPISNYTSLIMKMASLKRNVSGYKLM
jgi:hypothetical protein